MKIKKCKYCNKTYFKNIKHQFVKRENGYICLNCDREHSNPTKRSQSRKEIKLKCMDILGNKCAVCNITSPYIIFDFHHIDPSTKSFGISQCLETVPFNILSKEIQKCALLCACCHADVHAHPTKYPHLLIEP